MELTWENLQAWGIGLWAEILRNARLMTLPHQVLQLVVLALCGVFAWLLARRTQPKLEDWARAVAGRPKWQLRAIVVLRDRLEILYFAILAGVFAGIFKLYFTFPSRRYLLVLAATIAIAWFFIRVAAQLVRNHTLRQTVIWGLSIYAALYYLGLLDRTAGLLDDIAINFGAFHLSVLALIKAALVTGLLFFAARFLSASAQRRIGANTEISPSMRVLTIKLLQIVLYSAAFFIGLKAVGFDLSGLAVLSGAIGVGLGFGLQKVVSNLVSGVIILLDKSIKPGDVISIGDTFGWIESLGARYVSVVTRDGKEYLVPNEDLITGQVVNWSHTNNFVRLDIFFGTSYGDDPHRVREIAIAAAKTVPRVLASRTPVCHITGFGESSVNFILRFWIVDPADGLTNIRGNVYLALWDAFKAEGISLPFPQREVRVLPGSSIEASVGQTSQGS